MGEPDLKSLGRRVASLQDDAPQAKLDDARGRARWLEAASRSDDGTLPQRPRALVGAWSFAPAIATAIAAAIAVVVVAAVVLTHTLRRAEPLVFAVTTPTGETSGSVGAWVASSKTEPRELRFSDGSELRLEPGARVRITELRADGADIALEEGSVEISVVHHGTTRWDVRGGPYTIHVVGTRFRVGWDPAVERFGLAMREGAVTLSGPVVGEARSVRAGEKLAISRTTLEVGAVGATDGVGTVAALATNAPAAAAPRDTPLPDPQRQDPAGETAAERSAAGPAPRLAERSEHAPPTPSTLPGPSALPTASALPLVSALPTATASDGEEPAWRGLARRRRYREALAAAEAQGFDALESQSGASELDALADIARRAGSARAAHVYKTLRSRFPGTPEAARAAFLLGRIAQDITRDHARARDWFVAYLAEDPGGDFVAEAMGRLIDAADRSFDSAGARAAAQRYLTAYPEGERAPYAREVLGRGRPGRIVEHPATP